MPVIEELPAQPVPESYFAYLRVKLLCALLPAKETCRFGAPLIRF